MIELSARTFLFDLRVIRRLLQTSATMLGSPEESALALEYVERIIERIEDVNAFIQAIEAEDLPLAPQADLG